MDRLWLGDNGQVLEHQNDLRVGFVRRQENEIVNGQMGFEPVVAYESNDHGVGNTRFDQPYHIDDSNPLRVGRVGIACRVSFVSIEAGYSVVAYWDFSSLYPRT